MVQQHPSLNPHPALAVIGETALHITAAYDRIAATEALLEAKADINAENQKGRTPLAKAVIWKRVDTVALLLEAGADPSIADADGWLPSNHAANAGVDAIVDLLPATPGGWALTAAVACWWRILYEGVGGNPPRGPRDTPGLAVLHCGHHLTFRDRWGTDVLACL